MRTGRLLGGLVALTLASALSACSTGVAAKSAVIAPSASSGSAPGGNVAKSDVCTQVRAGIDAFNQGDFDATVEAFTRAVPLAQSRVDVDDTPAAEQLLAAVTYYARLAPDDYLSAAQSSTDFQRYKAITLGQCEGGSPASASPSAPGLDT